MKLKGYTKLFSASAALLLMSGNVNAQEESFDLSSQRSEIQDVLPVPGKKIDHNGIIVNPVPHKMTIDSKNTLDVSLGFNVNDRQNKFGNDLKSLKKN